MIFWLKSSEDNGYKRSTICKTFTVSFMKTGSICHSLPSAYYSTVPATKQVLDLSEFPFTWPQPARLVFLNQNLAVIGYKTMPLAPSTTYKSPWPHKKEYANYGLIQSFSILALLNILGWIFFVVGEEEIVLYIVRYAADPWSLSMPVVPLPHLWQ